MTKLILAALSALAVLFPAGAGASTTIIEPIGSRHPYQQWVDEARVPTPEGVIRVVEGTAECTEYPVLGCTDGSTIWVEWPAERFTFLHELGHAFAFQHPTLAAFTNERFANSYALCARLPHIVASWDYLKDEGMRGSRLRTICGLIRRTA